MEKSKRFAAPEAAIRLWFWLFAAAALIARDLHAGSGADVRGPWPPLRPALSVGKSVFRGRKRRICRYVLKCCARLRDLRGGLFPAGQQAGRRVRAGVLPDGGLRLLGYHGAEHLVLLCGHADRLPDPEGQPLHAGQRLPVLDGHCPADDRSAHPLSGRRRPRRDLLRLRAGAAGLLPDWADPARRADPRPEDAQGL